MEKDDQKVNSIEKAMEIILKFQEVKPSWGIRELSSELGFSPATVQRILQVLKTYEFVRQDPKSRQYYIGNIFYRFLENLNNANDLVRIGRPFLEEVAAATLETVHLSVIEQNYRLCIDHIESPKVLKAGMPIGNKAPLYTGASAKCLLAFSSEDFQDNYIRTTEMKPLTNNTIVLTGKLFEELYKIKEQGYAISLGERTPGLGSISAPVFDHNGQILASLSVAIPEVRLRYEDHQANCIDVLLRTAAAFSKAMGLTEPYHNQRS
ncbi:MAG: IclR family transcriptional regulator [Pseudomonadota bacterium]